MNSIVNMLIISCTFLSLLACGAADHQRLLNKRVYGYNQQLRWSEMDSAQSFVDAKYLEDWRACHLKSRTNVKLVSIQSKLLNVTQTQPPVARFKTRISWYIEGEMKVQESTWEQTWQFQDKRWMILSEKSLTGSAGIWP
jgi:hypothetical protein